METTVLPALPASFDYTALDAETRIVVQQRTSEIKTIARRAATDIIEIGQKLIEVKERLDHGHFGKWLQAEFGWSDETAFRFMRVTAKFGQIPHNVEFAPTALYLLSGGSVPDEARVEAITRAEAGEKITVAAAQAIVQAARPWASSAALVEGIQAYMAATWPEDSARQVADLRQVTLFSSAGTALLDRLMRSSYLPAPRRRDDVLAAVRQILAEAQLPAARAVVWSPGEQGAAVDVTTDGRGPTQTNAGMDTTMYATNIATTCAVGTLDQSALEPKAEVEVKAESAPAVKTEAEVAAAAEALRPAVWRWLKPPVGASERAALDWQKQLTGSLLDLEGFSAKRGRNFDWENLVAFQGAQVDHAALRLAVGQVRALILGRLERAEAEAEAEAPLTAAVERWLAELAEASEIPTDRNGAPEADAVRLVLRNVLHNRSNGGAAAWRQLRSHPAWPAGTADAAKLAAVGAALRELTGPQAEAEAERSAQRPPSWAGVKPNAGGNGGAARSGDRPERTRVDPAVIAASVQRSGLLAKVTARLHGHFDNLLAYAAAKPEADPALAELLVDLQGILDLVEAG